MKYIIKPGFSFVDSDGSVKSGGDSIALSADVATAHSDKVEACELVLASAPTGYSPKSAALAVVPGPQGN